MGCVDGAGLNFGRYPVTDTSTLAVRWILKQVQDDGGVCKMTAPGHVGLNLRLFLHCIGEHCAFVPGILQEQ